MGGVKTVSGNTCGATPAAQRPLKGLQSSEKKKKSGKKKKKISGGKELCSGGPVHKEGDLRGPRGRTTNRAKGKRAGQSKKGAEIWRPKSGDEADAKYPPSGKGRGITGVAEGESKKGRGGTQEKGPGGLKCKEEQKKSAARDDPG